MSARRPDARIVLVLVVAFGLRLAWALTTTRTPIVVESGDAYSYFFYGRQFARGGGYLNLDGSGRATAYYPPGYPAILGGLFWLLLHTPLPDRSAALAMAGSLLNVAFGTGSVLLLHVILRTMATERTALIGAALLALWPNAIFYVSTLQLETTFVFLSLAALAIVATHDWSAGPPSWRRVGLFGASLAAVCLVRPFAAPFVVVPALAAVVVGFGARRAALVAVSALAPFVVLLIPWTLRNERAMGAALPFSSNTGDTVCLDRSLDAEGGFRFADHEGCADPGLGEVERNARSTRLAIEFVKHHPAREALQIVRRLRLIFGDDNDGLSAVERGPHHPFLPDSLRTTLRRTADGWFFVMLVLAAIGLLRLCVSARRAGRVASARAVLLVLPFLSLTATAALLWGTPRFHLPTIPFLAAFAACGLAPRRVGA
ncbi:MAG TPA: hypothetical protein VM143_11675 [Acidimicrobiales bacterium]|nr:hypothetical protein [Acidimicrobiales bacterium]